MDASPEQTATHARVVEVATGLFAKNGYHATGVAEIGAAAGLRSGGLYYHIGSKEQLLFEVLRAHVEASLAGEEAIAASDAEPEEKLSRLIDHHVRTIIEHRDEVRVYVRDHEALRGEQAAQLQALRDRVEAVWRQVLEEGVRQGSLRSADGIAVSGLLGFINFLYLWYDPEGPLSAEELAGRFSEMILDGIRTSTPPPPPGSAPR